ncbi:MAG: FKBP-type peptidyl-prolyl cis-trans isomerase [Cellvibrionaceae bacterium]
MTEISVGPGTQVTLHFAVKLDDGSVVDSTFDTSPATFVVGDQNLLEGFEQLLFGLSAGDKNSFEVLPEQGFGQRNPNNIQEIPRDAFDEGIELSEGLLVSFADANNKEMPGVVQSFDDDNVMVDFNHPLAGRNLIFDVEILAVEPAITH